jgi:hypothetical protein
MGKSKVGELQYKITGDSKELNQSLEKSQDRTAKFTRFMKSALGIGGAVIAIRSLIRLGKDLVQHYAVQEQAENRLAAAIRATGGDVDALMEQYKDFASAVQAVTTVGDEQTLGLLQQAQSLGVARERMEEAAKGAIGLSRAFGIDMNTALRGIALAFEGQYTMLNRYIPALRTASDETERQAILQEAMASGFEIATAEAETGTGAMEQLRNAIGDLKEQGGAALTGFLRPSIRGLTNYVQHLTDSIAKTRELRRIGEELAAGEEVAATDRIALLQEEIRILELRKGRREEDVSAIEQQIKIREAQIHALGRMAQAEALTEKYRREGAEQAAKEQERRAAIEKEYVEGLAAMNAFIEDNRSEYERLAEQLAYFESFTWAEDQTYQLQLQAEAIELIKEKMKALREKEGEGTTDTWEEKVAAMAAGTDAAMEQYQLELDAFAAMEEEKRVIAAEAEAERTRIAEEEAAKREQVEQSALDFMTGIWSQLDAIGSARARREMDQLRRQHDLELESFQGTEEQKAALAKQFQKEEAKLEYEAALRSWKMQLAGALAAAARAVIESMKLGFPWAIPMVAMAIAQSGLQLAALHAAKPVPAFAIGADFIVPPGYPNDSYPMMVESGEHVVVEPRGGGETVIRNIINLDGRVFADFITRATKDRRVLISSGSVVK